LVYAGNQRNALELGDRMALSEEIRETGKQNIEVWRDVDYLELIVDRLLSVNLECDDAAKIIKSLRHTRHVVLLRPALPG